MEKKSKFEKLLLEVYYQGFRDELKGKENSEILHKAYSLGQVHALLGDDVRSLDYTTEEELLELIFKKGSEV